MTVRDAATIIGDWFRHAGEAIVLLPDSQLLGEAASFTSPLTFIAARPHKLLLELGTRLLVVTELRTIRIADGALVLSDFNHATLSWQEPSTPGQLPSPPHVELVAAGVIRFEPPAGPVLAPATWTRETYNDPWPHGPAEITPTVIAGDPADWARIVAGWFATNHQAHIYWPDGWRARPWDNQYALTFAAARSRVHLLELNTDVLVMVHGGTTIPDTLTLTFLDFAKVAVDGYASHVLTFDSGSVLLLGSSAGIALPYRAKGQEELARTLAQLRWRPAYVPQYVSVPEDQ